MKIRVNYITNFAKGTNASEVIEIPATQNVVEALTNWLTNMGISFGALNSYEIVL